MDYKVAYISRRRDLKIVLKNNIGQIAITDKKMAIAIKNLKDESFIKFIFAIILLIVSLTNCYNLAGWILGVLALKTVGYKIISSIAYLGISLGIGNLFKLFIKYRLTYKLEPEDEVFDDKVFLLLIHK